MSRYELEKLWVKGSLPGVTYNFDDAVRSKTGGRAGEVGRIVALLAVEPRPDYVIDSSPTGEAKGQLNPTSSGRYDIGMQRTRKSRCLLSSMARARR